MDLFMIYKSDVVSHNFCS